MSGTRHRLPPLVALRAFEAAARHLSCSRAAAELGVTHGAISHQVRGLEAYLGFALFRRLPRRLVLTEAGEALFMQVRTAFDLLEMTTVQVMAAYTKGPLVVRCAAPIWCNAARSYARRIYTLTLCRTRTPANTPGMTGYALQAWQALIPRLDNVSRPFTFSCRPLSQVSEWRSVPIRSWPMTW